MQSVMFVGRLAADPQVTEDFAKAVFRLLENRGRDPRGGDRIVGVNCVSWARGLNERVIARALRTGCEVVVTGAFIDSAYTTRDGASRVAKELVVRSLTALDWTDARGAADQEAAAA